MILIRLGDRSKPIDILLGAISGILKCLHTVVISVHVRIHSREENTVGKEIKNVRRGRGPCPELAGVFQVLMRTY